MLRIVLPRQTEVVVVSFGGVGTSFLLEYLGRHMRTNAAHDEDGFKHSPLPPISMNPDLRFVYLHGDPRVAVVSLFNRCFHHDQSIKMQCWRRGALGPIPRDMTLEQYVADGIDRLYLRDHFLNWYERYPAGPTMFLRYETLFDHLDALFDFLGMKPENEADMPRKKERETKLSGLDPEILGRLDAMYAELTSDLSRLADVELRHPGPRKRISMQHFSPPYLKALSDHACTRLKGVFRGLAPGAYERLKSSRARMRHGR